MPVSVVCESSTAANVNAALRDSLANSSYGSSPGSGTNSHHDESLQNKLVASAKRVLLTKIEYEEVNNYNQSVLDTLKSKYIVLKPSLPTPQQLSSSSSSSGSASSGNGNCGKLIHTPATTTTTSGSSSSSNHTSNKMNGNGNSDNKDTNNHHSSSSMANSGDKQQRNNTSELPQPKRILFPRESIQIGWKSSGRKWYVGSGMSNVGNTCYLNSTLQALFHVPSIANWLTSDTTHMERCEEELGIQGGCIICCMSKTLLSSQSQQSCIRPFLIYGKLKTICRHLTVGRQEDAHEFLRYLVEAMEKAYLMRFRHYKDLDQFSKETTPPNQILGGYLKSAVRCLACGYVSTTFQHFEDLLLDIRKADTIDEALEGYFSRERLEDMGYKCESCKKKVSATKQFSLERAPIALCIQLKRFSMLGTKINKQITIRPRLDLSRFASKKNGGGEQLTYKLVAMVTHLGASQNCGHYTAIGLTESGTYYSFDDSFVRPISVQSVVNTNAYIIFYELEGGQQNGHSGSNKNSGSSQANNNEQSKENNQKNGNSNYNNSNTNGSNDNRQNFYGSSPNGPKLISKLNTEPKVIGPQLPEYYKTGNSNGFPGNGNKLVNTPSKLSNRPSSLPTSTGTTPNSSKIMIHFKNSSALNNGSSNATAVSSSSAAIASPATSSTDKLKILPSESEDEDEEKVTTTSNEVSSTTTLPHMPKLGMGSPVHPSKDKSAAVSSTATAAVSATIKSPLKSLVPYESESDESSADEENDTKTSPTCSSSSNTHTQNSKSPKKKKKKNEIDLLFKRKSNGVANSSPSPKKIKTASANDADTSTHNDFEDDSGDDSGNMKKSQSTPPSPPVIKTKTGLWQVTNLNPSTPSSSNSKSNQQQTTPTDKKYRNPFAAVRSTSPVNRQPAPTHKPTNFNSTAKSTNGGAGGGERSEVVNELMKQSHRGYGAPVLSWNGNKTELEKEITEEARLQRKREWEEDDENEMDRGRQKKVKQPKAQVNATPGFNPFQEHQSQQNFHQRRWKLINNPSNHRYQNTSSNGGFRNGGGGGNNRKMNNFKRFGNKFHQRSSSHHQRSNGNYFHRRGS